MKLMQRCTDAGKILEVPPVRLPLLSIAESIAESILTIVTLSMNLFRFPGAYYLLCLASLRAFLLYTADLLCPSTFQIRGG